jgi:hypothetical protein
MRRLFTFIIPPTALLLMLSCGGSNSKSPAGPSTPATPTKIISLSGDLSFGSVDLGSHADRTLTISNSGNTSLAITSLSVTGASGTLTASWTSGSIAPASSQNVTVRFTPTAGQSYSGVVTVVCDSTAGVNTTNWSGTGVNTAPPWTSSGTGDTVFDMPTSVSRVKITGIYTGYSSNFVVRIGGSLVVNELLGTGWERTHFEGTCVTKGGVTEITKSSGVSWSFAEVRTSAASTSLLPLIDR